jgi:hypothetical protein
VRYIILGSTDAGIVVRQDIMASGATQLMVNREQKEKGPGTRYNLPNHGPLTLVLQPGSTF